MATLGVPLGKNKSQGWSTALPHPSEHRLALAGELALSGRYRFIACQPIFNRGRSVFGYELLSRCGWENRCVGDTDALTRTMIAEGANHGFEELTSGTPAFINCTQESLVDGLVSSLPGDTVLEILETVQPQPEVLDACRKWKHLGYKIALDDFRIRDNIEGLVRIADFIKVDFRLSDRNERREIRDYLQGESATLLAEKIETEDEFELAMEEGFELFQGYFLCPPTVYAKRDPLSNGPAKLHLLQC